MTSQVPGKLIVRHRSKGVAMGTLDGFLLMRTFGEATPEDIFATLPCHEAIMAVRPLGLVAIVAVDPTTPYPSEAARRAAVEVTKKTRARTLGHVTIILGDGFWASAFRGVLTTLTSLHQATYPKAVVRHEAEGVDWAIETLGESPNPYRAILLAALAELKSGSAAARPFPTVGP